MGKKIIKLSEIDIENIVKKVISEQVESNKCTGTNEIKPPFIKTEIRYKDENGKFGKGGDVPAVVKFHLRAYFPTAGSSDEVYQDALLQLKQQVEDELSSKQLNAKYDLVLVRVDNVIGSASNYLNGPLQPTHYRGKPIESSKLSSEPYMSLPKEGDSNWNKNKGYADSRWGNMVSYINKNGKSLGFGVGKDLKAPKEIEYRITDTGGCTDEKRDVNKYKGPGQYVIVNGYIKLNPIKMSTTEIEQLKECGQGLKIIVGFFKEPETVDGIEIQKNTFEPNKGHSCDYATFTVYCNGVPVGISNMNNGIGRLKGRDPKMLMGLKQKNVFYRAPKDGDKVMSNGKKSGYQGFGDTVYSVISVSEEKLERIAQKSKNGKIDMQIRGTNGSATRNGNKVHGEAPMVCAYTIEKGGKTNTVYGPQEPFGSGKASLNIPIDKVASIGSFDPCVPTEKVDTIG